MVWIIGEYAERIDNADELLGAFLESFPEEPPLVRGGQLVSVFVMCWARASHHCASCHSCCTSAGHSTWQAVCIPGTHCHSSSHSHGGLLSPSPTRPFGGCGSQVQLQLLTATVKLFLKRPQGAAQTMIGRVLSCATNDTDNPDLRDRAYIYWRLLSTDPEVRCIEPHLGETTCGNLSESERLC
jgi:hypothetical protein